MDDESGKVIDGTARARHWRRSQPKSTAQADGAQNHSEAPKSIASSLLVPPTMLDGELASSVTHEPANGNGGASSSPMHASSPAGGHRNLFLSPDAAVPAPPTRRSMQIPAAALRLVHRASAARRAISDIRVLRPRFSLSRTRAAAGLGLAAAGALAVTLVVALQPSSSPRSHSVGDAGSVIGFHQLKERMLLSAESAFAAVSMEAPSRTSATRTAARHSVHRVRHVRRSATRIASVPTAPRPKSTSGPTRATSGASVATGRASSGQSTATVSETPAQQSPTQQTHQQQQVHYQPPSQPAGPAGLGSQVGGNCNPKCS